MVHVEYITIKNASQQLLDRLRRLGEEKALRMQNVQNRWDAGDYKDVEVLHV